MKVGVSTVARRIGAFVLALAMAACGGTGAGDGVDTSGALAQVTIVDGDAQRAAIGQPLPGPPAAIRAAGTVGAAPQAQTLAEPARFVVVDAFGNAVPAVDVTSSTPDGGVPQPPTARADAGGLVATRWTLGPASGTQTLAAQAGDLSASLVGVATQAAPGDPVRLVKRLGDFQRTQVTLSQEIGRPTTFDRLLRNSTWPEYSRPVDTATGLTRIAIRLGLDTYYELDGRLEFDARGRATGSGSLLLTFGGVPVAGVVGTWTARRR